MMTPTIHSNGSSSRALLEQAEGAVRALHAALQAMQVAAPNARDYYPQDALQDGSAFRLAQCEHDARVRRVREVLLSYSELAEAIDEKVNP